MVAALSDWERYAHDPSPVMPLLVRAALLHYQFETIHPFLDGNGRLGRLLIVCSWWSTGRSRLPLLPLSPYFERHRGSYYRHLQQVREQGQVQEWLRFFLRAVTEQATDAVARARRLLDLREDYRQALRGVRSRATDAVDLLFASPVLTRRRLATELGVTVRTATKVLRQLTELGALREVASGQGALSRWYADEILAALED